MIIQQSQWSVDAGWSPTPPAEAPGPNKQLVLIFGTMHAIESSGCFTLATRAFPGAAIIGCTTAGEIHGTTVSDDTVSLTAIAFEHTRVDVRHSSIDGVDRSFDAGKALAEGFAADDLKHVFVLSEGMQVNGSELVRGLTSVLPNSVGVTGGFAGDGNRLQETHIWYNGVPEKAAAVAFGLYGDRIRVNHATTGGWDAFGPERMITKSTNNVLFELDGQPALALYKQYLGEYAEGLPATGLLFPLEVNMGRERSNVLRALLAVDEERGSITFAGDVPERCTARLMIGRIEHLIDAAHAAASLCVESSSDSPPQLSIVVSCNGRRPVLKQRIEEEVEAAHEGLGGSVAMTGFYSYGEIGPMFAGGPPELHNQTMSITTFAEI